MGASRTGDRRLPWACDTCHRFYELELVARGCHEEGDRVRLPGHDHDYPRGCCAWQRLLAEVDETEREKLQRHMDGKVSAGRLARAIRIAYPRVAVAQHLGHQVISRHRLMGCVCCGTLTVERDDLGLGRA